MGAVIYETTQIDDSGLEGAFTVGASAVELMIGTTIKDNRSAATLYNNSTSILYWGYTSSVTTSTGTPIVPKQFISWNDLQSTTTRIFLIAGSAGNDTRITEVS